MTSYSYSSTPQTVQALAAQTGNRHLARHSIARGKGPHVLSGHGEIQVGARATMGRLFERWLLSAADGARDYWLHHTLDYRLYPPSVRVYPLVYLTSVFLCTWHKTALLRVVLLDPNGSCLRRRAALRQPKSISSTWKE